LQSVGLYPVPNFSFEFAEINRLFDSAPTDFGKKFFRFLNEDTTGHEKHFARLIRMVSQQLCMRG
jgi:hypothetical protein